MCQVFLIEQPVHLFENRPGEHGVYKQQDGVLIMYGCVNF